MGVADRIYTGRHCTLAGQPGVYEVRYWTPHAKEVWVKGVDEAGKELCSLDPSGTLGVARKDVHWIKNEGEGLWS